MKKLSKRIRGFIFLLCLLAAFAPSTAVSQIYFKEIAVEDTDVRLSSQYPLTDSTILLIFREGKSSFSYIHHLVEFNTNTGEWSEKTLLPSAIDDDRSIGAYRMFKDTLNQRYVFTCLSQANNGVGEYDMSTLIVHLNYNYEPVFDTAVRINDEGFIPYTAYLTSGLNLLQISYNNSNFDFGLYKLDIYGNLVADKIYRRYNLPPDSFIEIPNEDYYFAFQDKRILYINKNTMNVDSIANFEQTVGDNSTNDACSHIIYAMYLEAQDILLYTLRSSLYKNNGYSADYVSWDTTRLEKPIIATNMIRTEKQTVSNCHNCTTYYNDHIYIATNSPAMDVDVGYPNFHIDNAILLQKFSIDGQVLWSRSYASPQDGYHYYPTDVLTDAQGNIVVFSVKYELGSTNRSCTFFKVDKETGNMIAWDE